MRVAAQNLRRRIRCVGTLAAPAADVRTSSSLFLLLTLTSALGHAQARPAPDLEPSLWRGHWPQFSWVEGTTTLAAGAVTAVLALRGPEEEPRWRGGILFDDAVRSGLRLDSAIARQRLRTVGDWPYYTAAALPLVIDPLFVAWLGRGDATAAVNMELMGLEAFSYAGLFSFISTAISVRERPDATECHRRHPGGAGCDADTEAFWSGHTSIVAASAGLVCANHYYMPLWGSPAADTTACVLAASGALVTGTSRLMADRHYASDVLVGMGVGFAFGYGVPALLHYTRKRSNVRITFQPDPLGTGALVSVAGPF